MVILIALSPLIALVQAAPAVANADPLWLRLLLAGSVGGVAGAVLTGVFKLWEQSRQRQADVAKLEVEIEARLRAEARTQAARLRQSYINALPYHVTLLRNQMMAVRDKLANDADRRQMSEWFLRIKKYGARQLFIDDKESKGRVTAEEFSSRCHYEYIFAMSTLYHTSVFLFFSQRILSLAPFTEVDAEFSRKLDDLLKDLGDAFARKNAKGDPEEVKKEVRERGLWETVQNNMGAIVRKDDWYLTYPQFCRIFVDIEQPQRDDHAFMRALDFYGAFDEKDPYPLLTVEGADGIVSALNSLLNYLEEQRARREAAERERRLQTAEA
jgi:hypothetical protein